MKARRATKADIEQMAKRFGARMVPTMKAWAGEINGEVVALGGLAFIKGRWIAFCDVTDAARAHPFVIARTAKRIFAEAKASGIKFVYAGLDETEPGAEKWLDRLGFELTTNVYRWRA